jgi:hypothetical protein
MNKLLFVIVWLLLAVASVLKPSYIYDPTYYDDEVL